MASVLLQGGPCGLRPPSRRASALRPTSRRPCQGPPSTFKEAFRPPSCYKVQLAAPSSFLWQEEAGLRRLTPASIGQKKPAYTGLRRLLQPEEPAYTG